jgi:mRNA-degrading endonuclease toxin of MazEF toxin-antitoxin module
VHGHGALTSVAGPAAVVAPSAATARLKTTVVGLVLMGVLVALVHLVVPLQTGRFYPVGATLAGAFTGFLYARAARTVRLARQIRGGAWCAALTGAIGTLGFALLGHLPLQNILIAGGTCAAAGATGALLGALSVRSPRKACET